jgi:hypothetical protein
MTIATTTCTDAPYRRRVVPHLMISCPHTGNAVDTRFDATAIPSLATAHLLMDCVECGQDHVWRTEEAFVETY